MTGKNNEEKGQLKTDCPNCGTEVTYLGLDENPYFPFCCERCKLVDLDKWLNEEYRIQSNAENEPREETGQ